MMFGMSDVKELKGKDHGVDDLKVSVGLRNFGQSVFSLYHLCPPKAKHIARTGMATPDPGNVHRKATDPVVPPARLEHAADCLEGSCSIH